MTDTKKRLTTIIRNQDPIHKEYKCVTNIKKFRPKLNNKDKQILDDLIEKHKRLAIVAEETQMEMIQLTIDKLGLDVIADIDHRSKQHMELLGREEMIQIEADKDILRKKMPHATRMKYNRDANVPVEQPLEVTATLLGAAGMLDDGITADIVYERFLLCVDRNFSSEEFDAKHYRAAMYMILDALSMTLFSEAQREEVRRRISVGQKRRWRLMSEESSEKTRLAMSNAAKSRRGKMSLEQRLAKHKRRKKTSEERIAMRNAAKRRKKKTPEERIAMRKAIAVYHFRVTKIDTNQIVLEGLPQSLVLQSDFGKEYKETTSNSLRYFLEKKIKGEGTIRLTVAGVEYSIEKYYKEKRTNF